MSEGPSATDTLVFDHAERQRLASEGWTITGYVFREQTEVFASAWLMAPPEQPALAERLRAMWDETLQYDQYRMREDVLDAADALERAERIERAARAALEVRAQYTGMFRLNTAWDFLDPALAALREALADD